MQTPSSTELEERQQYNRNYITHPFDGAVNKLLNASIGVALLPTVECVNQFFKFEEILKTRLNTLAERDKISSDTDDSQCDFPSVFLAV